MRHLEDLLARTQNVSPIKKAPHRECRSSSFTLNFCNFKENQKTCSLHRGSQVMVRHFSMCRDTADTWPARWFSWDAQSNLASTSARSLWSQFKVSFCAKPTQTSIHSSYTQNHVHSVAGPHIICRKTQAILPVCGKVYLFNANRNQLGLHELWAGPPGLKPSIGIWAWFPAHTRITSRSMQVKEEHFKDCTCSSKIAAEKTNIHHIKAKTISHKRTRTYRDKRLRNQDH